MFAVWGYQAEVVYEGESVCEVAKLIHPDVVFWDIGLPGIDAHEVARQLRRLPGLGKALLVALAEYGGKDETHRCQEAGIDYHFRKPVDLAELKKLLEKVENRGS
jgi:CheY-like chemotaxis protein